MSLASYESRGSWSPDDLIAGEYPRASETVTIASGADLVAGSVLGQITKGAASVAATGGNTGNGVLTLAATPLGAKAKVGAYVLRCTVAAVNGGTFAVTDPDGYRLADATVGVAYAGPHINFTVADGSADFAVGDTITVTVAAGSGQYRLATAAALDGSADPVTILAYDAAAATATVRAGIYLTGEFREGRLTLGAGLTLAAIRAPLAARHIFLRRTLES
ncbi:hypothetical protein N825_25375 [Skermanella stibiiresistens SB22]|uniref:Head decoration protein n=1 Tax=Skermanella stibiiresistens SB22 TaxID=1385369 RepID=W9GZ62_9PROT|nr:head decoration protein [Skermanella stibiiresistens]EWY36768.1 hypothetical protein N825_25375 [Skermanella stibiiresistens SB22]